MNKEDRSTTPNRESEKDRREVENKGKPENNRISKETENINVDQELESGKLEDFNGDAEKESALKEIRKTIEVTSDDEKKGESDLSEGRKETIAEFQERIEKEAEKFSGSITGEVVNFVRDEVSDCKFCKGPREGYAEIVSKAIIEVLTEVEENTEGLSKEEIDAKKLSKVEELKNIKEIIDIGGGYGDNLQATIQKIKEATKDDEAINGVCLDEKTSLSNEVEKDEEIMGSYQDACETSFEDNSFDLVMATHLLQEMKGIENKKKVLLEMKRISKGKIALMVEKKRSGVDGIKDLIAHVANNFNTKFDVLGEEEYKELFEELGFMVESEVKSDPNKITYLLKFEKEKEE